VSGGVWARAQQQDLWFTERHLDRVNFRGLYFSAVSVIHIHSLITDVTQCNVSER